MQSTLDQTVLDPETAEFYRHAARRLRAAGVQFLVGGAYALGRYTGVVRHTKDFDIFVRPQDAEPILAELAAAGYRTEMTFPHWLGKVYLGDDFVDVIFSSGNGVATVDDVWFEHAVQGEVLGEPMLLIPVEEMIWSKSFVCERERYDGADINHLLRARGRELDWRRVLERFGPHWRVLLSHLILFGFVYPGEQAQVPHWVMDTLLARVAEDAQQPSVEEKVCQGTLLSREQYQIDLKEWGYRDARLVEGTMSRADIRQWTEAAKTGK